MAVVLQKMRGERADVVSLAVGREEIRSRQRHDDGVLDHLDDERGAFPHAGFPALLLRYRFAP
jgi:hypothetical protein